jgi:transcriptional regulator with XRE-family HTH domain
MDSIGARLRIARQRRFLTQEELAKASGVQVVTISRIENDRQESQPRLSTIRKLATALGIEAEWIMFGDEDLKAVA